MTTTISLATRDCIVLGCDSLATSVAPALDPFAVADNFFEQNGDLKLGGDGRPLLKNTAQLSAFIRRLPRDQLPNVTKLYHLKPYKVGVTFAGASVIGDYSIKNLVDAFLQTCAALVVPHENTGAITVENVAKAFYEFTKNIYENAYKDFPDNLKPSSEVLLSGYSTDSLLPEVFRLRFAERCECTPEIKQGSFNIAYSGQYDVIERVVDGVDLQSYISLNDRLTKILSLYKTQLEAYVRDTHNLAVALPDADQKDDQMSLFGVRFGGVKGLKANTTALSEQAAINFVEFLVDTMIKAQQFSGSIPTVGGDIHIAIITKAGGFCWISKEEYLFKGHTVQKHQNNH